MKKDFQEFEETQDDIAINVNAYQEAVNSGQFNTLAPGTLVAFDKGLLVGTGADRKKLFQELEQKGINSFFFHPVNEPEITVHLGGPHKVKRITK